MRSDAAGTKFAFRAAWRSKCAKGRPWKCQRALMNLLANACKFVQGGGSRTSSLTTLRWRDWNAVRLDLSRLQ